MGTGGEKADDRIDFSDWIPIFPLPTAVLLPRTILPLHVFEPRYRAMTRDALAGPGLISIALLRPGFEKKYDSLEPEIHGEVCVGRILRDERLDDGRYNLLLQGLVRARVTRENTERAYRRAILEPIPAEPLLQEQEDAYRGKLWRMLAEPPLLELAQKANWLDLLYCPDLSFSDLLDVLASVLLPRPEDKQKFLAEPRVAVRSKCICGLIEMMATEFAGVQFQPQRPREWPPRYCSN